MAKNAVAIPRSASLVAEGLGQSPQRLSGLVPRAKLGGVAGVSASVIVNGPKNANSITASPLHEKSLSSISPVFPSPTPVRVSDRRRRRAHARSVTLETAVERAGNFRKRF